MLYIKVCLLLRHDSDKKRDFLQISYDSGPATSGLRGAHDGAAKSIWVLKVVTTVPTCSYVYVGHHDYISNIPTYREVIHNLIRISISAGTRALE